MPMIYPKWVEPVILGATIKKGIDADVKDPSRLKRIRRVCKGEPCGDLVRSYKTDFYIIDAFWHTFDIDGKPEEYLCLCGANAIEFHSVIGNKNHPFPLVITINAAFSTKQGILLQRAPQENERGINVHVYALTNPLNELTPVVVTGRSGFDPHLAFSGLGTEIVGVSEAGGYVLVHDYEAGQEQLFMVRPCSKHERSMPKKFNPEDTCSGFDLASVMESSMCCPSPGVSSIYSQNSASRPTVANGSFHKTSFIGFDPHLAFSGLGTEIVGVSEAGGYVLVHDYEAGQEQLFMATLLWHLVLPSKLELSEAVVEEGRSETMTETWSTPLEQQRLL
uniref:Anaphase-promoting complex subunit 1 n=1 Tax=Steinernema glaseri TaxID=37863 RepID=A0A1I7ZI16_9BILA